MDTMLSYMIPAMNPSERLRFMTMTKAATTPEVFGKIKGVAETVLEPKSWRTLSARLGEADPTTQQP
jgi:hypothetical protein